MSRNHRQRSSGATAVAPMQRRASWLSVSASMTVDAHGVAKPH
jgi:hypothetical protein